MAQRPKHNPTSTIEGPRPTEERTFLITDVRGYTRFTQEHGDQSAARLYVTFGALAPEARDALRVHVMVPEHSGYPDAGTHAQPVPVSL